MQVQGFNTPIDSGKGWLSLLEPKTVTSTLFLTQFFVDYTQRIEALSQDQKKSELNAGRWQGLAMRQVLRDYYMRSQIEKNADLLTKTLFIAKTVEPDEIVFDDIDSILQAPFDPDWPIFQHLIDFVLKTDSKQYLAVATTSNDGSVIKYPKVYEQDKLLRYRFVHHFLIRNKDKVVEASKKQIPLSQALEKTRKATFQMLVPKSKTYKREAYFYTLLKCHEKLRSAFNGMLNQQYRKEGGTRFNCTADDIAEDLTSQDDKVVKNALKVLKNIRINSDGSFFPNFCQNEIASEPSPMQLISSATLEKGFKALFFEAAKTAPLSQRHRLSFLKLFLEYLKEQKLPPQDLFLCLCELSQLLYKNSPFVQQFKKEMDILTMDLYLTVDQLHTKKGQKPLYGAWRTVFGSGSSEECRRGILSELNMECVRLIRKLSAIDLYKDVDKFMPVDDTTLYNFSKDGEITPSDSLTMVNEPPRFTIFDLFNNLASLISSNIIMADSKTQVLANYETSVKMAHEALNPPYVNAFVTCAIVAGLSTVGVSRLQLEGKLGKKSKTKLKEVVQIASPTGNFKNYRDLLRGSKYPVIPYVGLIGQELTMACEAKKSDEQIEVVQCIVDSLGKTRHLLKSVLPLRHTASDCIDSLKGLEKEMGIPRPPYKIELKDQETWKEGEWDKLARDEKLYFYSKWKWA